MNKIITMNEVSIKHALSQGYITSNEARHMLKVYLQKTNFSPFEIKEVKPSLLV